MKIRVSSKKMDPVPQKLKEIKSAQSRFLTVLFFQVVCTLKFDQLKDHEHFFF